MDESNSIWNKAIKKKKRRRHADGQQAQEKMVNITNTQRNENWNHNEIPPHTCQNGYHEKGYKEQMLIRM